jgi:hypothetical protein
MHNLYQLETPAVSTTLSAGSAPQESQAATVGLLLLGAVLAALWIGINLMFPGLAPTGIPSVLTRLAIHAAILAGLWLGLSRTDFSMSKRITIWLAIAIAFTLWLAVVWAMAVNGAFQPIPGVVRLPRLPIAIFAPVIIGLFFLLRSKSITAFLDAIPAPWLIALQVYRIFGGIFLVNWMHGTVAGVFAVPAGIGDVLTGIMALPVALLLASGTARGRSAAMAWNIFGLLDFAVAITLGTLSSPGPFQIFGLDIPASLAGTYPTVLIPAFAVPSSILLHALSIRQLRRIGRRAQ